jgi:hypothetical protein
MAFCTIISGNFIHYALALNDTICKYGNETLYILIVDKLIDKDSLEYDKKSNL